MRTFDGHASLGFRISLGTDPRVSGISKPKIGSFEKVDLAMDPSKMASMHLLIRGTKLAIAAEERFFRQLTVLCA